MENLCNKYGKDALECLVLQMENDKTFAAALEKTALWEGGYVNNPNDPGGETKFGITKRWYPKEDIKNLTRERANYILYRDYFCVRGICKLPDSIAWAVFDNAVNQGQSTAVRNLQKAIGVKADGVIGSQTLSKIAEFDAADLLLKFQIQVQNRYNQIYSNNSNFAKTFKCGLDKRAQSYSGKSANK